MKINKIFTSQILDLIQHIPCKMFMNNQVIDTYSGEHLVSFFVGESIGFPYPSKNYLKLFNQIMIKSLICI